MFIAIPANGDVKGPTGVVRVGIFQFEPFNYLDKDGSAKGLNPDLLREIVRQEPWTVEFVPGSWAECLERLQRGEIDLMMSVAYSTARSKEMDYTYESVSELWGQVFIPVENKIRNISDLTGRRVGVMKGDISAENFKKTASNLGITCDLIELSSHHDVFKAVQSGQVIAGVAPQHFGLRHTKQYNLVASSIMFSPFSIFFTTRKGDNHELLSHIDAHLAGWKRDENSFYYDRLNHWLGWTAQKPDLPTWFLVVFGTVTLVAVVFVVFTFSLRRIVARKTQELLKSEERFKLAMEATKDGLWDWNVSSGEVHYSRRYKAMLGYDSTEIQENVESWLNLIHPDDKEKVYQVNQDCVDNCCDDFQVEYRMQHRLGGWTWILGRGMAAERDSDGQATRMIGTHTDITLRKELEKQLRESEEKYRSMMEAMLDPVYICSSEKTITYMNPAMMKRVGRDATGEKCHVVLHGLDERCSWCRFLEGQTNDRYELDIVSGLDNRSYHVANSIMKLSDGSVQKLTVFRDTTEMKEIQSQLQRAQEMQAIGNLAGGIAHDFNNILCPIIGMSEMFMLDFAPGSVEYENAAEILKAGTRGSELVQQILAYSRQTENKKAPLRVQAVIKEVLKLCRATIPSSIDIQHKIQDDSGLVEADSTQIHQVAMNLITNAFHAVEENEGKVYVELQEMTIGESEKGIGNLQSGKYVRLSVSDNGCGISPEITDKIFDPYFTTKETGKGTGLGLATVLGIVKDHKGDITVSSTLGKGTSFEVFLPVMESSQELPNTPKKGISIQGGTESILLVDDEASIVNMEKKILERVGYRVTERMSSVEALRAFEADPNKFDLVISDMTMPGMTGDELAQKLLAIKPDLPIVICTGYSERISDDNIDKFGIKGLLRKPVLKKDLLRMVRYVLD